jgi:hypothetical protein
VRTNRVDRRGFAGDALKSGGGTTDVGAVSERQVRLLYKTTCWTCDAPIAAGTLTWWDDERAHATCTGCRPEEECRVTDARLLPTPLDHRTRRRIEIMRAHRPRVASR